MRDRQTGSMKELTNGELTPYALTRDPMVARHLSVLVVDNNEPELQLTIRQLAEAWPFARDLVVDCATDGLEAVAKIRRYSYAFVVLDLTMPHPAGPDVLQAIRANGLRVPVVAVSAQNRTAIASDLESLAAAFVNKRQLNPTRFCNAMAAAILLTQRVFGWMRPLRARNSSSLPAHAFADKFEQSSSPLSVRPTALAGLWEPKISVRETARAAREGAHRELGRVGITEHLRKNNSLATGQVSRSSKPGVRLPRYEQSSKSESVRCHDQPVAI